MASHLSESKTRRDAVSKLTLFNETPGATAAAIAWCLLALTQCKGQFTGPYPCETGYDSCVNSELNYCETDTQNDAAHCGACGKPCDVGAVCQNAECGTGAQKLADLTSSSQPIIAVNSFGVYFSVPGQNQISKVPLNGGTPSPVASNVSTCGGVHFALDDTALYYWTSSYPCTGNPCINTGMVRTVASSGLASLWLPNSQVQNSNCPSEIALNSNQLFWLDNQNSNQNNSLMLIGAPLAGGTATTLAQIQNGNSNSVLWATRSKVLFVASQNGPSTLFEVPVGGGTLTPIPTQLSNQNGGLNAFVADDTYIYVANGGCPCNDGQGISGILPKGTIDRFALDGSGGTTLAEFDGLVASMTRDATNIYWSTDTTVWKMPMAGGAAVRIAGNLMDGAAPDLCTGGCGSQMSNYYVSIAVDGTSVYIADGFSSVSAILKVAK